MSVQITFVNKLLRFITRLLLIKSVSVMLYSSDLIMKLEHIFSVSIINESFRITVMSIAFTQNSFHQTLFIWINKFRLFRLMYLIT